MLARKLAKVSTVLLKNENNILPLDKSKINNIAVLGKQAYTSVVYFGEGSGRVRGSYLSVPLSSLRTHMGIPEAERSCDGSKFEDNVNYN